MYQVFTSWDDIFDTYGTKNCRNLSDRLFKVYDIHRQPRPRINVNIYANRRCLFIQRIKSEEVVTDVVMETKRKRSTDAFRNNFS